MLSVLSDSKNSELRRAIGMNGTRLNSIFPLVSEKIEPSVFISHFDFKINWSNAQNESNWRFLSVNSMRNGRISQLKAPTIEYCEKALALFLFWSVYVLIVENQKITSDLNIRNGYYPFKLGTFMRNSVFCSWFSMLRFEIAEFRSFLLHDLLLVICSRFEWTRMNYRYR